MEAGHSSRKVERHVTLRTTEKGRKEGRYTIGVFSREETWRAAEVARAGSPTCLRCWLGTFDRPKPERVVYRRTCLAVGWLVPDCYRPDRR
jgi:hypothetical protein